MRAPSGIRLHVHRQRVERIGVNIDDSKFLDRVALLADEPYSAILLSGGTLDCSKFSIAATDPFMVFTSKGRHCRLYTSDGTASLSGDPLEVLDAMCGSFAPDYGLGGLPFAGGAVGYIAYDLKNQIEELPQTAKDDDHLPDIFMFWPSTIFLHERLAGTLDLVTLNHDGGMSLRHFRARTGLPWDIESESVPHSPIGRAVPRLGGQPQVPQSSDLPFELQSSFTQDQYLAAVSRIKTYIRNGDVYQVNLSQRFEFPFEGNPFHFWRTLFSLNPAPFYSYIQAGSHQVLSTSMERFLYLKDRKLETRPIKGTRKRGKTPGEDQELRTELADSPKDDAELSMIVDLLRNDLGRVCEPRSIRVADHKRLEAYTNVHHMVSTVTGILRPDVTYGDLVRATFPGGSITGCPKIRAMEIIDELEPITRHVYTGSIGYLGWHDNLDLNIAIRTAVVRQGRGVLSVGGGVVYDSDPQDEYEETLHKGRTFLKLLGRP